MTTHVVKEEEIEEFLNNWIKGIKENIKGKDLIFSNNINGIFSSPSKRKQFFQTAGFAIAKVLKTESIKPFFLSIPFGFFFIPKGEIDFKKVDRNTDNRRF